MLLLLACVSSDGKDSPVHDRDTDDTPADTGDSGDSGDTDAAPVAEESSRASCTVKITIAVDGQFTETCTGTYDDAGRDLSYECLDADGYVYQWQGAYDDAGCYVYDSLYVNSADFGYRDERDITCDEHLNAVTEIGEVQQYTGDGTLDYADSYDWLYTNTYSDDLLVERLQDYGESRDRRQTRYTYTAEGWLEREREGYEGARFDFEALHAYDDLGNRIRTEYNSSYYDSTWERTYDTLARVVESVTWSEYDDVTSTRNTEWEGDTLREAHEEDDRDGDGVFETTLDFAWTCPE